MSGTNIFLFLFVPIFVVEFSSAYVKLPRGHSHSHAYGQCVRESRPPTLDRLELNAGASFEEEWNRSEIAGANQNRDDLGNRNASRNPRNPLTGRARNVAQFCLEVGCTIHDYQRINERLKRLKVELSNKMLGVEDELDRLRHSPYLEKSSNDRMSKTSRRVLSPPSFPFQSWWSSLIAIRVGDGGDRNRHRSMNRKAADEYRSGDTVEYLLEQRKKLSDRALAIQNLLTILHAMEESSVSPPSSAEADVRGAGVAPGRATHAPGRKTTLLTTRELASRYRGILEEEGIKISTKVTFNIRETQKEASVYSYWESLWNSRWQPKPPRLPPTTREFMNQCDGDRISRAIADSADENLDEECIREWFGSTRSTTYPTSTSLASTKPGQVFGRTRATVDPFSGDANATSETG